MALFSTLSSNQDRGNSSSISLNVPTIVQLFTEPTPIQLEKEARLCPHGLLSYQAVPVRVTDLDDVEDEESNGNAAPELGVWSCRVHKSASDSMLSIPTLANVFVFSVNLASIPKVEPTVTSLQQALIRHLIETKDEKRETSDEQLTSLYDLRSTTFGLAPEDTLNTKQAAPDETDRQIKVCLNICATLPPALPKDDYSATQSLQLVLYHLRRFASSIGATLTFTASKEGDIPESSHPTLSNAQLAYTWQRLAQGYLVEDTMSLRSQGEEGEAEESPYSRFYGPKSDDLIETVWLRNAQYPGHWDATKDSLWKVFPAQEVEELPSKPVESRYDQDWLGELQASLASVTEAVKTPAPKKSSRPKSEKKTPGKDVNDFFTSLLDKK